ncbi:hypothetical protein [Hyphobacterium sp.]|uniref:hypothetical protein n=1 Tax=Hyphobacterium sp. TaxID=2004662 RepID=UPI003B52C638
MTVLICSASLRFRQSLETVLSAMGCVSAASVGDAGEARQQSNTQHFDIAIVDADTFEAQSGLDIPMVRLVSGSVTAEADNALAKPFRPAELAQLLTNSLAESGSQAPSTAHAATP